MTLLQPTESKNVADTGSFLLARLLLEEQVIYGAWLVDITGKYVVVLALTTMRTSPRKIATSVSNSAIFLLLALLFVADTSSLVDANNTYFKDCHK